LKFTKEKGNIFIEIIDHEDERMVSEELTVSLSSPQSDKDSCGSSSLSSLLGNLYESVLDSVSDRKRLVADTREVGLLGEKIRDSKLEHLFLEAGSVTDFELWNTNSGVLGIQISEQSEFDKRSRLGMINFLIRFPKCKTNFLNI